MSNRFYPYRKLLLVGMFILAGLLSSRAIAPALADPAATGKIFLPVVISTHPGAPVAGQFGKINYSVDSAHAGSGVFPADGVNGLAVSATDAAGFTWTLNVPKGGLVDPTPITLTPFATVDASGAQLPVRSGVRLEPDGLVFLSPATLTLTPPASAPGSYLLLTSARDGSNLNLAENTRMAGVLSATIYHFSAAEASIYDTMSVTDLIQKIENQYAIDSKAVQALMFDPGSIPVPPDAELDCHNYQNGSWPQIDAYQTAFWQPESEAIHKLMGDVRTIQLLNGDANNVTNATNEIEQLITSREIPKVQRLLDGYANQPLKYMAVARVTLSMERTMELMGGPAVPAGWEPQLLNGFLTAKDFYQQQMTSKHDYSLVPVILSLERTSALLGVNDPNQGNLLQQLMDFLTFKLVLNNTAQNVDVKMVTQGDITTSPNLPNWNGTGTVNYVSGTQNMSTEVSQLVLPLSFTVNYSLTKMDFCNALTGVLTVDKFGSNQETFLVAGNPIPGYDFADTFSRLAFYDHLVGAQNGPLQFILDLHNQDVNAVDQVFNGSFTGGISAIFHVQLIHTPK